MTCILYFLGSSLISIHCLPPAPELWIEPERAACVAYYLPRPPRWGFDA